MINRYTRVKFPNPAGVFSFRGGFGLLHRYSFFPPPSLSHLSFPWFIYLWSKSHIDMDNYMIISASKERGSLAVTRTNNRGLCEVPLRVWWLSWSSKVQTVSSKHLINMCAFLPSPLLTLYPSECHWKVTIVWGTVSILAALPITTKGTFWGARGPTAPLGSWAQLCFRCRREVISGRARPHPRGRACVCTCAHLLSGGTWICFQEFLLRPTF